MNKKIKILFLVHSFCIGGITVNTLDMIKHIDYDKFDVHILYIKEGMLKSEFEKFNVKFLKIGNIYNIKSLLNIIYIIKICNYVRKNKIDIIHTQDATFYMMGSVSSKLSGCKHIRTQPNLISVFEKLNTKTLKFLPFEKWTDKYIALNNTSAKDLVKVGVKKEKVEVIYGYSDNKDLDQSNIDIRKQYNIPLNKKIICNIGRLVEGKCVDKFIDIAKYMIDRDENIIFMIVGDGDLKESLIKKCEDLNIYNKVIFTGFRTDKYNIINQIDLGVFPVRTHAGMTEVVVAGKVLISGKSEIMSEYVIDGVNGFLIDDDNPESYVNKAFSILYDEARKNSMEEESRIIYRNILDEKKNIRKFQNIVHNIVSI